MNLLRLCLCSATILAATLPGISEASQPNFILINIDDLGYGDVGPFGSKLNRTPNLDRMAREGRLLTSHYAAPVCSPSRASLMTGCYPKRVLPIPHVLFPAAQVGLNPEEQTIAELLKEAGYFTAALGKWHLGDQPEFLPNRQGFDYYFGLPYSNDMGPAADGAKSNPDKPLPAPKANRKTGPAPDETGIRADQPPLPLLENGKVIERVRAPEQPTLTRRYTQKAKELIEQNRGRPFFLYLAHTAVHFPLYPAPDFMGKSRNGLLGDWVEEVDWSVGEVLKAVRELDLGENTMVIFTSDNGGSVPHGSTNYPLRGSKGSTLEGGIRVPTIAWWPGKIPAGTRSEAITSMMDILPTFVTLGGGKLPPRKLDGVNLWPVLCGEADEAHDCFYYFRGLNLEAVRSGPWKLHLSKGELYNLQSDIGESSNMESEHPEVIAMLKKKAAAMSDDLGLEGIGPGCRPLGRVAEAKPLITERARPRAQQ